MYGSASIGALRAVELTPFGMIGAGAVFEVFRDGVLWDDDEVALQHGPAEAGHVPVSEAMVNVQATLEQAVAAGVISAESADAIEAAAKSVFYKERSYDAVLDAAAARDVPENAIRALRAWLRGGRVDQKRADALAMLDVMRADHAAGRRPPGVAFTFHHTAMWEKARRRSG